MMHETTFSFSDGGRPDKSGLLNGRAVFTGANPVGDGKLPTTVFVDPDNLEHDMHVNIVMPEAGAVKSFEEIHIVEDGMNVLEGKATLLRGKDRWSTI